MDSAALKILGLSSVWSLGIALSLLATIAQAQLPVPIDLQVNRAFNVPSITFDRQTQAWLDTHPTIKVGVWAGALPPLHMNLEHNKFEGVSAEYLEVLRKTTGLQLQIMRYATRAEAGDALKDGQIDMLTPHDVSEGQEGAITQSRPYLLNRKVIVRRTDGTSGTSTALQGQRLEYIGDDAVGSQLQKKYPKALLIKAPNYNYAMGSLTYDQADALWTDSVSAEYLIRLLYSNNLYIAEDAGENSANINFAVSDRLPHLLAAINQTLDAIPINDMKDIATRWGLSSDSVAHQSSLNLDATETAWLAEHPKIRVIVDGSYAPLTFFDDKNQLQGLSADLFNIIKLRTGLDFEFIPGTNVEDMINGINNGRADLIAAINISELRLKPEQYTRPYLVSPFVVVTKVAQAGIHNLDELDGTRLAVLSGDTILTWLSKSHPQITQVPVSTTVRGLEMLAEGQVDGALHTQFGADYFIKHYHQGSLKIAAVIGPQPSRIAMAVSANDMALKTIINKVLRDIPPERFKSLNDRWRNNAAPAVANSWTTYQDYVYNVIFVAAAFALLFSAWVYYLLNQIRKRRKAEQALGDQLAFSNTLIDGSPIALYVRDKEGRLAQCNPAYLEFLQTTREETIGKLLVDTDVMSTEISQKHHQLYLEAGSHGQSSFSDLELEVKGVSRRIYHWTLPFLSSAGEFSGVIGGWLDISEREQLMEQLRLAKVSADEANESKSIFLASMSHEIRTPISALIGLIEMLRVRSSSPEQIEENLCVAHQSAQSLLSLIGDILDLSKIEAGAMVPSLRPTNLKELVIAVNKLFHINAKNKQLLFELIIDVDQTDVLIDALMVNQIVANLISNAIKFTDRGFVSLSLKQLPDGPKPGHSSYVIDVSDSGRGLNESQKKAVFEPFIQVGPKITEGRSTGLGLSICTRLATLLGAQLSLQSLPSVGSCFTLSFSAEHAQIDSAQASTEAPLESNRSLKILVAEDHAPNRLLLCQQLEYLGHHVVACDDGEIALGQWLQADPPFDLTITDCNMPNMDGYELTRTIRSIEMESALASHPIFGLTANAQSDIVDACLNAGMTQCLFKPISIETLTKHVGEVSMRVERRAVAASSTGGELQKLRILSPDAYQPLVEELVRTNREDGARLVQLILQNDLQTLIGIAHKIKGGALLADAKALIEACVKLESCAQQGDRPACHEQVDILLAAVQELEDRLLQDL